MSPQPTHRYRSIAWRFSAALNVVLAALVLSASSPRSDVSNVEQRLAILESAIRVGPDGALQTRGPFQVTDAQGKVRVSLMVGAAGHGIVETYDGAGHLSATLKEVGLNVFDPAGNRVAGVTRGLDGLGRVVVFRNQDQTAIELAADETGNGRVLAYSKAGKLRAGLYGETGLQVFDDTEQSVASVLVRNGRGVMGVKTGTATKLIGELTVDSMGGGVLHMKAANGLTSIGLFGSQRIIAVGNTAGKTAAEIAVDASGGGIFQVWGEGKVPLAVMGRSKDAPGGIVQVSNGKVPTSSLTVSDAGNGYWQLNDAAGEPMVEAGVTQDKRGLVRAGPMVECIVQRSTMGLIRMPDCIRGRSGQ